jgi:hypothetical protein
MKRWAITLCVPLLVTPPPIAMAFCFVPQPRLVCAEYFASPVVVEATLVRTRDVGDKEDPEAIVARVYTLNVDNILRGKIAGEFQVNEGNDSGRATFDWTPGTHYLLFLFYLPSEKAWALDGCGNSGLLKNAQTALSEIGAIRSSHDGGMIQGLVSQEEGLSTALPGVRVEAWGETEHFVTTTDGNGAFHIKVPPGQYHLRAFKSGYSFSKADISYGDPQNIQVEPGGCSQLQLVGTGVSQ